MANLNTYLLFDGNCEEAFNHYKSAFGGDFSFVNRYGNISSQTGMPELSEKDKDKIENICFPINDRCFLMGSDGLECLGQKVVTGNNFSIYIEADNKEQADNFFTGLSDGGIVKMPMTIAHWGDYFGICTDKFGISWFINCAKTNIVEVDS